MSVHAWIIGGVLVLGSLVVLVALWRRRRRAHAGGDELGPPPGWSTPATRRR